MLLNLLSSNLEFFPNSLINQDDKEFGMVQSSMGNLLATLSNEVLLNFAGEHTELGNKYLCLCPLTPKNATALRDCLPWLKPRLLGLQTSAGLGDRLGLATPGHVRAVRSVGGRIAPIFAQQSMREMARTGRTPQQVMDDATWGIFQECWQEGVGADADHLKTTEDIDACFNAGFTFFTIDPGAHVQNRAESANLGELRELAAGLPDEVSIRASGLLEKTFQFEHLSITFSETTLLKAVVKYGQAIAHVAQMYRHLEHLAGERPFELEVSVDETDQPTHPAEHVYIACELKRLGVRWVSLAPRYIGRFEKGVDYIGDLDAFEADLAKHAEIARYFGPYKLSLHSGSDKFSIYPEFMRQTGGLAHLKTAGTSYLEALHSVAQVEPDLFREIYIFARQHYEADRLSYHVSAELERAPQLDQVVDLIDLLTQFDAREILHVTFGSVLTAETATDQPLFYDRLFGILHANREVYAQNLEKHFQKHLQPFVHQ